jgi:hypothetical protein
MSIIMQEITKMNPKTGKVNTKMSQENKKTGKSNSEVVQINTGKIHF